MGHGKKIKITTFLLLFGFIFCTPIVAEVGNSGGFDSGDSGSSWDSDSSWDYSDDSFDGEPTVFETIVTYVGIVVIVLTVCSSIKEKIEENKKLKTGGGTRFNTSKIDEPKTIKMIMEVDPDFSVESFKQYASDLYIKLQKAWQAKDWKAIRTFESNSLFNTHRKQLQEYIDKGETNILDKQNVKSVELADFYVDGDQEVLIIRLNATCVDFTIDDKNGKVIQGYKTAVYKRSYYLQFIRKAGIKTSDKLNLKVCPNCGAKIEVSESGECEYCKTVITSGEYGWVLNKYGAYKALRRK